MKDLIEVNRLLKKRQQKAKRETEDKKEIVQPEELPEWAERWIDEYMAENAPGSGKKDNQ